MSLYDQYREICIESPLYSSFINEEFEFENSDGKKYNVLELIESSTVKFDCYCTYCDQSSTFIRTGRSLKNGNYEKNIVSAPNTFFVRMSCTRNGHDYFILFMKNDDGITKIGMYPSMEDIANSDLKKYRGLLERKYFSELHRAGGLASHGIGIGSFVYMRRIFEKQIMDHYERKVRDSGEIEEFHSLRMNEKIKSIEDYLPSTLVKHRDMYSILSAGIHELDEETCLAYYPPLKQAIILILEQDYQIKEKEKAAEELERSFKEISKGMKKQ